LTEMQPTKFSASIYSGEKPCLCSPNVGIFSENTAAEDILLAKRSKCAVSIEAIKDVWTYMMLFLLQWIV
jgi:hypothetical protein